MIYNFFQVINRAITKFRIKLKTTRNYPSFKFTVQLFDFGLLLVYLVYVIAVISVRIVKLGISLILLLFIKIAHAITVFRRIRADITRHGTNQINNLIDGVKLGIANQMMRALISKFYQQQ